MKTEQEQKEFYERLKKELEETSQWPSTYLYKFIIPNDTEKKHTLEAIFEGKKADIKTRTSSNGKYTSVSISILLQNPDEVIAYYKEAGKIEGILSL
ncbi:MULTISPECIES: DUF493 family protein [Capnocytophaga]|uniref:DUF493 domain-containing protein n=1 Tax=Capnocytophaga canis TaxID=1848903 RepID=A0A0B7ICV2_9FLAO|nr:MULTISPECIES: DUF493 family protein [Capnocytophaga]ATA72165.1 DUF493 domain-containing protein [Capnocytophaga sp. H4358]RIY37590.1 DUF493 domain-containing protein [Capnocytophaga canis]CEN48564.1 conserved hypothetical protein [Capnocytophaga canis]CEN54261.1 conserved hypothetical protein [Capnocytophaga canis]GIM61788.1 DUF493 domain-containing protein [Capnocytophaga canis]